MDLLGGRLPQRHAAEASEPKRGKNNLCKVSAETILLELIEVDLLLGDEST